MDKKSHEKESSPNDISQQPLLKLSIIISTGASKVNIFLECIWSTSLLQSGGRDCE